MLEWDRKGPEEALFQKKAELKSTLEKVGEPGQGSQQRQSCSPGWKGWYFAVRLTENFKAELQFWFGCCYRIALFL